MSVEVRADGSAVWLCWRCHASGGTRGGRAFIVQRPRPDPRAAERQRSNTLAACRAIWKQTPALRGTAGESYLLLRHCAIPPAEGDLRFHAALFCPEVGAELPALVARVTTVIGNKAIGVHRIWFRPGEAKAVKKMRLGSSSDPVCIRLWPDSEVALGLGIAEGIETALAAAHWFKPVWSTIDVAQMKRFPIVPGVESLTVWSDHDKAGIDAARAVGNRYRQGGRNVELLRPKRAGEDFNDVVARQAQA